ncbi:MAG: universal stress protein, partial [Bacteroidia bacterium]|nr:universal stress protein [Bacteroidia bacterium]
NSSWIGETVTTPLIEKDFVTGFAGKEIPELASKDGQCMIVIGSTGSSGSLKTIFGSVSTMIAKDATCPVFVVPPNTNYGPINKIAYAADDFDIDSSVVEDLIYYTSIFGAELHLAHVDDEKTSELNKLQSRLLLENPELKIYMHVINADGIVEGLNEFVEEQGIQLLAMTKQKRTFLDSLFHSSITKRMTINTKIPLLVLHR